MATIVLPGGSAAVWQTSRFLAMDQPSGCRMFSSKKTGSRALSGGVFLHLQQYNLLSTRKWGQRRPMITMELGAEARGGSGRMVAGARGSVGEVPVEVPEKLRQLQKQMEEAMSLENYKRAAEIRDSMRSLQEKDPRMQLIKQLEGAIAQEQYQDAARLRDELKKLAAPSPPPARPLELLKCFSDTTTQGVRVRVRSIYVRDRSFPNRHQFFFAYRIRISNESSRSVQLLNRHWQITDATGRSEEVRGPGVIGEQPVLHPGASFEYTSACPLRTPSGMMEGEYEMIHVNDSIPAPFKVKVGAFSLNVDNNELAEQ